MATVVICVILAAVVIYAVFSYAKKLSRGCCGGESDPARLEKPADTDVSHYPFAYVLKIKGMTCKNCAARIANAFNREEGFYASVNLKENTAKVLAKTECEESVFYRIIAKAGYDLESVEKAS